ncbi:ATP-binding protein [Aliiglaciecola sp. CAU 1673]|uniref:ATP-binding protein n=1 Tax=Aliiglaciecola sp. CAU 1673 TaxID=3032595 RepID=UPI0023D9ED74|nr:ATP-binding protein [Aliiglaciecola sp. CAU 1673]MDF2177903.1 ATP-binding protein [Aliiglaciecola sp. CAU 1673]
MARLFISFYLFIVLSLVGLAAILDELLLEPEARSDPWMLASAHLIRPHLNDQQALTERLRQSGLKAQWLKKGSIAWPASLQRELEAGEPVALFDQSEGQQLFLRGQDGRLLQVSVRDYSPGINLWLYSSLFFASLAVLLSLWIWPMWRDLSKLRNAANSLRDDGTLPQLQIGPTSTLYGIAQSFNQLSTQIKQLIHSQRELTGAVAHELRTPLSRLKFALAVQPQPGSEPWQGMGRDVGELERLVQEMLDYTSMETIAPEMDYSQLPLAELIADLSEKMRANCPEGIHIEHQVPEMELLADGHFVQRALQNIVQNALRYAKTRVEVSTRIESSNLDIMIDDDGPGVAEADRQKIFEPFFRPDHSRDRKRGGAGLGLAIVRRIQQWHGGSCWVETSPLGGARFVLRYPMQ